MQHTWRFPSCSCRPNSSASAASYWRHAASARPTKPKYGPRILPWGVAVGALQCETDRARFLGRCRTPRSPAAICHDAALSGTVGTVLDPVFSLRQRVRIKPGASARIAFWTLVASSRDAVLALSQTRRGASDGEPVFTQAAQHAQAELDRLAVGDDEARLFQRLAGALLYSDARLRSPPEVLVKGIGGPPTLWACLQQSRRPQAENGLAPVRVDVKQSPQSCMRALRSTSSNPSRTMFFGANVAPC